jgi:hypothetical protein
LLSNVTLSDCIDKINNKHRCVQLLRDNSLCYSAALLTILNVTSHEAIHDRFHCFIVELTWKTKEKIINIYGP